MTTYTQTQLANRVMKDAGLLGVDETLSADELADAIEVIGSEMAQMAIRGIVVWNGSDTIIPAEYLTALSRRLVLAIGPDYGLFTAVQAAQAIIPAEQVLRQLAVNPPSGAVQTAEYF